MSSLELFPTSQLIHLKPQHTVAKPAEHSDDKRGDSMTCAEPAECMARIGQNSRVRVADEQTQPRRTTIGRNRPDKIFAARSEPSQQSALLRPAARPSGKRAGQRTRENNCWRRFTTDCKTRRTCPTTLASLDRDWTVHGDATKGER